MKRQEQQQMDLIKIIKIFYTKKTHTNYKEKNI